MFDEFDLYNVVHKSVENNNNSSHQIRKARSPPSRKRSPGKKSTLLTAKSLDSHFTNGKHDWCLVDCGCDLYRTLIKTANDTSIRPRLENAEMVFFDFQPLSTRLALMTKFIVIAQGGTAIPSNYITVYPGSASSPTSTSRSKSFDSSLLAPRSSSSSSSMFSSPSRGVVMANSGLYVKIWANDGVKMSVFGTDPATRLNRLSFESCRLVPTAPRTIKPSRSSKISELMSNFEPQQKSELQQQPRIINNLENKTIFSENSHSESSLTNIAGDEYMSSNMTSNNSSNKTILTKSYSENNPRVLNTGVRIAETTTTTSSMATTTTTTTLRTKTHEEHQQPPATTTTNTTTTISKNIDNNIGPKTLPQRIQIPIRIEDPILTGMTNVLSDGSIRPAKTEVFTYSYQRKILDQPPSVKSRTGLSETSGKKRAEVRFDDSWERTEQNGGNQKKLLKSSEWALTKQTVKKD